MNITASTDKPVMNIPQRKLFDVCLELNKLAFPISRRDDALFYIRPDMCIKQQDLNVILAENGFAYGYNSVLRQVSITTTEMKNVEPIRGRNLKDELIYIPTEADLFKQTHGTVNQLTETLTSGWFAYTNVRAAEGESFMRGQGATPWFALADAWIQVQKLKTQNDLKANDIPDADIRAESL